MPKRPDYNAINKERQRRFLMLKGNKKLIKSAYNYYSTRPAAFINDWGVTYDPRNAGTGVPALMPFVLFKRQIEFINFLYDCFLTGESGAAEKCRDYGATWGAGGFSVWGWTFVEGLAIGWGSRKEELVDSSKDPDSIFEKMRIFIRNLPSFFQPSGFSENCFSHRKIINPVNGNIIKGEAGDQIGRGGRTKMYFKDESSHYERPELIESSLSENTDIQIDISSVNGPGTVFDRRVEAGEEWFEGHNIPPKITRVFYMDWQDHPLKTQEWYDQKVAKAEREGLSHVVAQEIDRDTTAAVEGVVITGAWVKAALDAHIKLGLEIEGMTSAALDVADEGNDANALAVKTGILLTACEDWRGEHSDVGESTRKSIFKCRQAGATNFQYDSIGVGAGVKSECNRLIKENILSKDEIKILPWCATASPLRPKAPIIKGDKKSRKNKDFYENLKSQGWWQLRTRFEKTYKSVKFGEVYPVDELISISSKIPKVHDLVKQLSQPTYSTNNSGKIIIDKKPKGAKSPNKADAVMMLYWPVRSAKVLI